MTTTMGSRQELDRLADHPVANDVTNGHGVSEPPLDLELALVQRLARSLARRLPHHIDRDELIALGNLGLVEARARFDPARGVPFGAFAAPRIRGAMLDGLRSADPLTREERARCRRGEERDQEAARELTTCPEVASTTEVADEVLLEREDLAALREALSALPERERYVISKHFLDEQPLKVIGEQLGVTESRVCQIVGGALTHLRRQMGVVLPPILWG